MVQSLRNSVNLNCTSSFTTTNKWVSAMLNRIALKISLCFVTDFVCRCVSVSVFLNFIIKLITFLGTHSLGIRIPREILYYILRSQRVQLGIEWDSRKCHTQILQVSTLMSLEQILASQIYLSQH